MALRLLFGRVTSPVRQAALITRQSAGPRGAARRQLSWEAADSRRLGTASSVGLSWPADPPCCRLGFAHDAQRPAS
jgi:hypothetical protein